MKNVCTRAFVYFTQIVLSSLVGGLGRLGLGLYPRGWGLCREGAVREPARAHPPPTVAPQHLQLVRQEMAVCPEQLSEFLDSLRQYLRGTAGARNCFQ